MIAFKGFTKDLTARWGKGIYQFRLGETVREEGSKTAESGFHCCENPFECLAYYPLGEGNRFWMVEAAGSIDEDGMERIACTEMTLLKELSLKEFAGYGMAYIVQHPMRDKWEQHRKGIRVKKDKAEGESRDFIAIARGKRPMARGMEGSLLGLLLEPEKGAITGAKLFEVTWQQAGKWFTIDEDRNLLEVRNED